MHQITEGRTRRWLIYSRPPCAVPRRSSPALRATVRALAGATVAAAIAVPLARKRLRMPAWATAATVAAGPLAIAVLSPRTKTRDVVLFTFQMWAFTIAHELPYDDPDACAVACGSAIRSRPTRSWAPARSCRTSACSARSAAAQPRHRARPGALDRTGSGSSAPACRCCSSRRGTSTRFPRAARRMAATYDLGCAIYYAVPTAPPWWASERGYMRPPVEQIPADVAADAAERAWPRSSGSWSISRRASEARLGPDMRPRGRRPVGAMPSAPTSRPR